ncbi:MAG TPA: PspC domain-containing protein [Sphingomicrobium sp.]|nr:PspC domain-containing protein [Sphingomicrobium sp.]
MSASSNANIFLRNDTIFGTCQAIGDDFGFNANWLRVPLAALVVVSPIGAIGGYLALSLLVAVSRSIFKPAPVQAATNAPAIDTQPVQANDDERELIAA